MALVSRPASPQPQRVVHRHHVTAAAARPSSLEPVAVSRADPVRFTHLAPVVSPLDAPGKPQFTAGASCPHCGNIYAADSKFCRRCGSKRVQVPEKSLYEDRLQVEGQQARIRNLESALEALRSQHRGDLGRLQATADELRDENRTLRAKLAEQGTELAARIRDVRELQEQHHEHRSEASTLKQQLAYHSEQSQIQHSLAVDKELAVGPLSKQVQELTRHLAVSRRESEIMLQDLEAATRRASAMEASVAAERLQAERAIWQVQESLQSEIQDVRANATEQVALASKQLADAENRARLLQGRCQLLQAACFRSWWCLDGGAAGMEQAERKTDPEQGRAWPQAGSDPVPLRRMPLPADWRSVLRFQAQLFHWLSAETAQGRCREFQAICQGKVRAAAEAQQAAEEAHVKTVAAAALNADEDEAFEGEFTFRDFLKAFRKDSRFLSKVSRATGIPEDEFRNMDKDELKGLFQSLDADSSGTLSFDEFVSGMVQLRRDRKAETTTRELASEEWNQSAQEDPAQGAEMKIPAADAASSSVIPGAAPPAAAACRDGPQRKQTWSSQVQRISPADRSSRSVSPMGDSRRGRGRGLAVGEWPARERPGRGRTGAAWA